jgi:hypothetical protein
LAPVFRRSAGMMEIDIWSIIKWILIVLLAGFIGHFGKALAQSVLAKIRIKKAGAPHPPDQSLPADQDAKPLPDLPTPRYNGEHNISPSSGRNDQLTDKKISKAIAKQTKKALKKK